MSEVRAPLNESEFATLKDFRDRLTALVEQGLGEHPAQILIVPDSTLQAIARASGQNDCDKPALMIDFPSSKPSAVCITSTDRWSGRGMSLARQ